MTWYTVEMNENGQWDIIRHRQFALGNYTSEHVISTSRKREDAIDIANTLNTIHAPARQPLT